MLMFKSKIFEYLNELYARQHEPLFLKDFAQVLKLEKKLSDADAKKITKQFFGYLELCDVGTVVRTEFGKRFDTKAEDAVIEATVKERFDIEAQNYYDELALALCAKFRISPSNRHVEFENLAGIGFGAEKETLLNVCKDLLGDTIIPTHVALIKNSNTVNEIAKVLLHCAIMPIS